MHASKLTLAAIMALSLSNMALSNMAYAAPEMVETNCSTGTTHASLYFQFTETVVNKKEVGQKYATYINQVKALEQTGHFKNMKIVNQQVLLRPDYSKSSGYSANRSNFAITINIEFDTNYDAYADLASKFETSSLELSLMTQQKENCE